MAHQKSTHESKHEKSFHPVMRASWQKKEGKSDQPAMTHLDNPMNADAALSPFWAWRITTTH
jgi:hypothetical protein